MRRSAWLFLLGLAACGSDGPKLVPSGNWAQTLPPGDIDIAELAVDAGGAATARFGVDAVTRQDESINYCATAEMPRLALDADGRFEVDGTLIGRGPGLADGPPVPAARFSGQVRGNTMTLTVTTVNGVWGRFELTHGAPFLGERICVD